MWLEETMGTCKALRKSRLVWLRFESVLLNRKCNPPLGHLFQEKESKVT